MRLVQLLMIGTRFHFLVVQEELEPVRYTRTFVRRYRCLCDCGAEVIAQRPNLLRGATKSCGCWKKMSAPVHLVTHGMSSSDEYRIWAGIRKRCLNPTYREYHLYGGRGIGIAERWASFENFYADMGPRPSKDHSIDRIDGDANYEPGNCRWATDREQSNNTSRNVYFQVGSETLSMTQLAERFGVKYFTIATWRNLRGLTNDQVVARLVASKEAALDPSPGCSAGSA